MSQITIHATISGRVQGVFYRDTTRKKATELGITGWVKNLPDGRVELLATGDSERVSQLLAWCWQGPAASKVTDIEETPVPLEHFATFEVRY